MQEIHYEDNHILIGLGGMGGRILREFKKRLFKEWPDPVQREKIPVAFLYVDAADELMSRDGRPRSDFQVDGLDASFTCREFLHINTLSVSSILEDVDKFPAIRGIVRDAKDLRAAIGTLGPSTGQKRVAGRLMFAVHAPYYVRALNDACSKVAGVSGQSHSTHIHLFAGLAGGTGSGCVIDAIVQARKSFPDAQIHVYAMVPSTLTPILGMDVGPYFPNVYAALQELNALQSGRWHPHDVTGDGEADYFSAEVKGVADTLTIYSDENERGERIPMFDELPKQVADYVFYRYLLMQENAPDNFSIIRACETAEKKDLPYEYDETVNRSSCIHGVPPVVRTRRVNTFGITSVVNPEVNDGSERRCGNGILDYLSKRLRSRADIENFVSQVLLDSSVLLTFSQYQLELNLRNNEPSNSYLNTSDHNVFQVSIPLCDDNPLLQPFADKLVAAFNHIPNRLFGRTLVSVCRHRFNQEEICLIRYRFGFPLRCIQHLDFYKESCDHFLHTGNPATDRAHSLVLYSEGDGSQFPSLFSIR